jgi:gas vesicle protein
MSGTQDAWSEVGERFATWGKQVAERYKESSGPAREAAKESQRKLEEAAHDITDVLDRAFTALGDTIRDEHAKEDLKLAAKALGEALAVTVTEAGEQVRRAVSKRSDATDGPATTAPGDDEGPDTPSPA